MPLRYLMFIAIACAPLHAEETIPADDAPKEDSKPKVTREAIEDAIRQLGDEDYVVRKQAADYLETLGIRASNLLSEHAEDPDLEIRSRIKGLLEENRPSTSDLSLDWLARHQEPDGHWDTRKQGADHAADLECTALALFAFLGKGHTEKVGHYKENVRAAVSWLRKQQREDGALLNPDSKEVDGRWHALAGLSLAEAAGMGRVKTTYESAQKAIDYSTETHQAKKDFHPAGFGVKAGDSTPDLLPTVLYVFQLKSAKVAGLKVDPAGFEAARKTLDFLFDRDSNSYRPALDQPPSPGASLRALVAKQFMGDQRDALQPILLPALKSFGPPNSENSRYDVLTVFFGTIVTFQHGKEPWRDWNVALEKHLIGSQETDIDNGTDGSWEPKEPWKAKGRVWATALSSLCVSVYYRYLPLYKE